MRFKTIYRIISPDETGKLSTVFEEIIAEHKNYIIMKKEMICLKIAELVIKYNRIFSKKMKKLHLSNTDRNLFDFCRLTFDL